MKITRSYQFWLDIGNIGWWERLDQPLTHPYVLNRNWQREKRWTDVEEFQANQSALARLVQGLLDRCEEHVYLYVAGLNQAGINQSSPLLSGMQLFLKRIYRMRTHEGILPRPGKQKFYATLWQMDAPFRTGRPYFFFWATLIARIRSKRSGSWLYTGQSAVQNFSKASGLSETNCSKTRLRGAHA